MITLLLLSIGSVPILTATAAAFSFTPNKAPLSAFLGSMPPHNIENTLSRNVIARRRSFGSPHSQRNKCSTKDLQKVLLTFSVLKQSVSGRDSAPQEDDAQWKNYPTPTRTTVSPLQALGQNKVLHRFLAVVVYIIPLLDTLQSFLGPLATRYPKLVPLARIFQPIIVIYTSIPYLSYLTVSGTFYFFVKGPIKFPYYVKFNAVQALGMAMFQYVLSVIYHRGFAHNPASPYHDIALLACTLTCAAAIGKSVAEGAMARTGNLPVISEAARLHVAVEPRAEK